MSSLNMEVPSSSGPGQWTGIPSEDDQRLREVGIAALAAMAQNSRPAHEENESFMVDQVVAAVSGNNLNEAWDQFSTMDEDADSETNGLRRLRRQRRGTYRAETDTSSENESLPGGARVRDDDSDTEMDAIYRSPPAGRRNSSNDNALIQRRNYARRPPDMVMGYEPTLETYPSSSSDSEEDIKELLKFYPGEEINFRRRNHPTVSASRSSSNRAPSPHSDVDMNDFYTRVQYSEMEDNSQPGNAEDPLYDANQQPANFIHTNTFENNLTVDEFIEGWIPRAHGFVRKEGRQAKTRRAISEVLAWCPLDHIERPDSNSLPKDDFFDLQQIPWVEILRVSRSAARRARDSCYTSYHNVSRAGLLMPRNILPETEFYFRERAMFTAHNATIEHFQLRNLISVPYYDTFHFANHSVISAWSPSMNLFAPLIDLSEPDPDANILGAVKISSMKSHLGLVVAGGFCGEYAVKSADGEGDGAKGLATQNFNDGITNHVDIVPNRTGGSPICVLSSNDRHLRILDSETNIFTSDQEMSCPINCTASSPDSRLRVVIGDSPDAWVIEAETGRPVHPLRGHRDFGFACAWSPDMRHIATSNQDKTVKIWDARTWRVLETIDSDVAGYRSLRFSPVGGGPRSLLCCEPADRISIINAQMYQTRQVHDFFGEIAGADFSPDGHNIWVANTDPHFGGFMQFERSQWGTSYGLSDLPNEWLRDDELDNDPRCVYTERERTLRFLRTLSDAEHDEFVL